MTNINCIKNCLYQSEGKCCCDSVMLPYIYDGVTGDSECPYLTEPDENSAKMNSIYDSFR